jgi:hypothetical protein
MQNKKFQELRKKLQELHKNIVDVTNIFPTFSDLSFAELRELPFIKRKKFYLSISDFRAYENKDILIQCFSRDLYSLSEKINIEIKTLVSVIQEKNNNPLCLIVDNYLTIFNDLINQLCLIADDFQKNISADEQDIKIEQYYEYIRLFFKFVELYRLGKNIFQLSFVALVWNYPESVSQKLTVNHMDDLVLVESLVQTTLYSRYFKKGVIKTNKEIDKMLERVSVRADTFSFFETQIRATSKELKIGSQAVAKNGLVFSQLSENQKLDIVGFYIGQALNGLVVKPLLFLVESLTNRDLQRILSAKNSNDFSQELNEMNSAFLLLTSLHLNPSSGIKRDYAIACAGTYFEIFKQSATSEEILEAWKTLRSMAEFFPSDQGFHQFETKFKTYIDSLSQNSIVTTSSTSASASASASVPVSTVISDSTIVANFVIKEAMNEEGLTLKAAFEGALESYKSDRKFSLRKNTHHILCERIQAIIDVLSKTPIHLDEKLIILLLSLNKFLEPRHSDKLQTRVNRLMLDFKTSLLLIKSDLYNNAIDNLAVLFADKNINDEDFKTECQRQIAALISLLPPKQEQDLAATIPYKR